MQQKLVEIPPKPSISEKELQAAFIETARVHGYLAAHFRSVPVKRGSRVVWETPVQADGKGFPDLCCVGHGRIFFCEFKCGYNKLSREQEEWLRALGSAGVECYLVTDKMWISGEADRIFDPKEA